VNIRAPLSASVARHCKSKKNALRIGNAAGVYCTLSSRSMVTRVASHSPPRELVAPRGICGESDRPTDLPRSAPAHLRRASPSEWFRRRGIRRRGHRRRRSFAVLQQRQLRQGLLHFTPHSASADSVSGNLHKFSWPAPYRQADRACILQIRRSHPGNTCLPDLTYKKLIGVHRRLVIAAPKPVPHFRYTPRDGQKGIRHLRSARP